MPEDSKTTNFQESRKHNLASDILRMQGTKKDHVLYEQYLFRLANKSSPEELQQKANYLKAQHKA